MGSKPKGAKPIKYHATVEQVICMAPADAIVEIEINDEKAWQRPITENTEFYIDAPDLFGGDKSEGGVQGWCEARFGEIGQAKSNFLAQKVSDILSATRGVLSVVAKDFYLGISPYAKSWHFRVKSTLKNFDYTDIWYQEKSTIAYDVEGLTSRLAYAKYGLDGYPHYTSNATNDRLFGFRTDTSVTPLELSYGESTEYHYLSPVDFGVTDVVKVTNQKQSLITTNYISYLAPDTTPALIVFPFDNNGYYDANRYIQNYADSLTQTSTNVFPTSLGGCPWASRNKGKWIVRVPTNNGVEYMYSVGSYEIPNAGHYGYTSILINLGGSLGTATAYNNVFIFSDGTAIYKATRNSSTFTVEGYTHPNNSTEKQNTYGHTLKQNTNYYPGDTIYAFGSDSQYNMTYLLCKDSNNKWFIRVNNAKTLAKIEDLQIYPTGSFVQDDCYFLLTQTYMVCICGQNIITMYRTVNSLDDYDGSQLDYNPAHAIREAITSKVWGLGKDESVIDDDNFRIVADTLYNEKLGISFVFESDDKVSDFIDEVLKTINGTLRIDRRTGLVQIKLFRADYDVNDLPVLDISNILSIADVKRTALSECVNQVTVKYKNYLTGEQASLVYQDIALIQAQGEIINADFSYDYVYWQPTAAKLAQKDLYEASSQFFSCTVTIGLSGRMLNIGDCVVLNFPHLGIENLVFRIVKISYGGSSTNEIKMELTQDKFFMPNTLGYAGEVKPIQEEPQTPTNIEYAKIFELPFYLIYKNGLYNTSITDIPNSYATLGVMISAYNTLRVDGVYHYSSTDSATWTNLGQTVKADFVPSCVTTQALDLLTDTVTFTRGSYMESVDRTYLGFIDDEIIGIGSVDTHTNTVSIARGLFDTVPQKHDAGAVIFFTEPQNTGIYSSKAVMVAGYNFVFKIPYYNSDGMQPVSEAQAYYLVDSENVLRMKRPYPIARLTFDGNLFPEMSTIDWHYSSAVTFKHRNKFAQIDDSYLPWISATDTSEEGDVIEGYTSKYVFTMSNRSGSVTHDYITTSNQFNLSLPCDIEEYARIECRSRLENDNDPSDYIDSYQPVVLEGEIRDIVMSFAINSSGTLQIIANYNYPLVGSIDENDNLLITVPNDFEVEFSGDNEYNMYRTFKL